MKTTTNAPLVPDPYEVEMDRIPKAGVDMLSSAPRVVALSSESTAKKCFCEQAIRTHVILLPWFIVGGAEREVSCICRAILDLNPGAGITILLTDAGADEAVDWLPEQVSVFEVHQILDSYGSLDAKSEALARMLEHIRPQVVFCAGTATAWRMLEMSKEILSLTSKLFVGVAMPVFDGQERRIDPESRYLPSLFDYVSGVLMDSDWYREDLVRSGLVSSARGSRLYSLSYPVAVMGAYRTPKPSTRDGMRVLWAGRLVPEKRPGLVVEIARLCPWAEFHMHGKGDESLLEEPSKTPVNVHYAGAFRSFEELTPDEYDCFLYTSRSDGMPNVLLEAVAHGLPVVAPNVGGIAEIIDADSGYRIEAHYSAKAYALALEMIKENRIDASSRAKVALSRLRQKHDAYLFRLSLSGIPSFVHG